MGTEVQRLRGGFADSLSGLIYDLYCLGIDVHVVQPNYRKIYSTVSQKTLDKNTKKVPAERVHLTEDRAFFYSNDPDSNNKWENTKISIAFQREVTNHIIPEVQPDLIHCHDFCPSLNGEKMNSTLLLTIRLQKSRHKYAKDGGGG